MFKHDVCLLVVIPERQKLAGFTENGSGQLAKVKSKEQVLRQSAESVSALKNLFMCVSATDLTLEATCSAA
jgi:hypothetical protein